MHALVHNRTQLEKIYFSGYNYYSNLNIKEKKSVNLTVTQNVKGFMLKSNVVLILF